MLFLVFLFLLAMSGTHPPHKNLHWEQLAVFTHVREHKWQHALFFAYNVLQEACAFPEDAFYVRIYWLDVR